MRIEDMGILGTDYYLIEGRNRLSLSIVEKRLYNAKPGTAKFLGRGMTNRRNFRLRWLRVWRLILGASWSLEKKDAAVAPIPSRREFSTPDTSLDPGSRRLPIQLHDKSPDGE